MVGFVVLLSVLVFQSTPPARGATAIQFEDIDPQKFQSTPPARGATPLDAPAEPDPDISIHAPREGGDPVNPT